MHTPSSIKVFISFINPKVVEEKYIADKRIKLSIKIERKAPSQIVSITKLIKKLNKRRISNPKNHKIVGVL